MMGLGQSQVWAAPGLGWGWRALLSFLDALEVAGSWQGGVSIGGSLVWNVCSGASPAMELLCTNIHWGSWS